MSTLRRVRARLRMAGRKLLPPDRGGDSPIATRPRREPVPGVAWGPLFRRIARTAAELLEIARGFLARIEPAARVLYTLPVVIAAAAISLLAQVGSRIWSVVQRFSDALRPEWAVAAIAVFCAGALGASQFVHYRGVEIDSLAYAGKIGTKAPAPLTQFADAGSAHSYVLLPLAALAVAMVVLALRGNWRFGRIVALIGLVGIGVSLLVDLPKGLDTGTVGLSYNGAKAQLSDGFYAQLASASMLVVCGLVLSSILHREQAASAPRSRRRIPRPGRRRRSRGVLPRGSHRRAVSS